MFINLINKIGILAICMLFACKNEEPKEQFLTDNTLLKSEIQKRINLIENDISYQITGREHEFIDSKKIHSDIDSLTKELIASEDKTRGANEINKYFKEAQKNFDLGGNQNFSLITTEMSSENITYLINFNELLLLDAIINNQGNILGRSYRGICLPVAKTQEMYTVEIALIKTDTLRIPRARIQDKESNDQLFLPVYSGKAQYTLDMTQKPSKISFKGFIDCKVVSKDTTVNFEYHEVFKRN